MKKLIAILVLSCLLSSCSNTFYDPTHPNEAAKAKNVRREHSRNFGGPY